MLSEPTLKVFRGTMQSHNLVPSGTDADKIVSLERQLEEARIRLKSHEDTLRLETSSCALNTTYLHALCLLSDSALPLGSFAFSSGLESFLAHQSSRNHSASTFRRFLDNSLSSLAGLTLPYVHEAHCSPARLTNLDNDIDASIACVVARRASVAQGRALVTVWERGLKAAATSSSPASIVAAEAITDFATSLKQSQADKQQEQNIFSPNGHLPPLFGVLCAALDIPLSEALYLYLFNHAKTLVSAGIRASVLGPYQGQAELASLSLQSKIRNLVSQGIRDFSNDLNADHASQRVPILDLWGGRHEILYSRIFNS